MRDAHEKLGKRLANGCSKTAYEHKDDPTKVVLVVHKDYKSQMDKEMEVLEQLANFGVPVLKFHDVYAHGNSLYVLCDRYKKGSKDGPDVASLTTAKTVAAFDRIEAAALRHRIYNVADFQFLWGEDGSIAVADPLEVSFNEVHFKRYYEQGALWFQKWQPLVEYAYQIKIGNIAGKYDSYAALDWWGKGGKAIQRLRRKTVIEQEKLEEAICAAMGIPTIRHRWRSIEMPA